MNLELYALVLGALGTIGTAVSWLAFFKINSRKKRAEARLIERQGDVESFQYFRDKIAFLEGEIKALQQKVRQLEDGKQSAEQTLEIYLAAGKKCHECQYNTEEEQCPAIKEYHLLKNK